MRIRPVWKRILAVAAIFFGTLWIAKSATIYAFFRVVREFDNISVVDSLSFPFNRGELAHKFGQYHIEKGLEAYKAKDFRMALMYLGSGLARARDHRDGRMALASIYRMMKDEQNASEILKRGLDFHGDDPVYLQASLQALMFYRRDKDVLDYADKALPALPDKPDNAMRMTAYVAAQVLVAHGRFADALDIIDKFQIARTAEGTILRGKILWTCNRREEAVKLMRSFALAHPGPASAEVHRVLCDYLHQLGRDSDALISSLSTVNEYPKSFMARKDLIKAYIWNRQTERARREVRNYLLSFGAEAVSLQGLADLAVEQADRELAIEVYGTAAENGHHMGAFGLMMIEAHLMARDYAAVEKFCAQIAGENPPWLANFDPQLNYLRLAAARGQGRFDIAALHLGRLQESRLNGAELLNMAKSLRKLGMNADARKLLEAALPRDPGNEEILALALEIDMDTGRESGFVDNTSRLLELRRPSYELLARIRTRMTSDRFIFEEDRATVLANLDNVLKEPEQALR